MTWVWIVGLLRRQPLRLFAPAAGIAVAVALLAALGGFLVSSHATMTERASAGVAVDWQVQVTSHHSPQDVLNAVRSEPGTTAALPVGFADAAGLRARAGGTIQDTGAGKVLGLPDGYASTFPLGIRLLTGSTHGVLIAQQTAANLHVTPGDRLRVSRSGMPAYHIRVAGVVELPQADSLFRDVGAPSQAQPVAPPDNVVLLPAATFRHEYRLLAHVRPDQVSTQIHAQRDQSTLPSAPSSAYAQETAAANHLSVRTAGGGLVGDNLGASLDAAREDAAYANVLFLFLGAPGAFLAAALTAAVTQAGGGRRRVEQRLLRARGSSPRQLGQLVLAEALVIAVVGSLLGTGVPWVLGAGTSLLWNLIAAGAGLLVAGSVIALPALRDLRMLSVPDAERRTRGERPVWLRFGLDLILITLGLLIFRASGQAKYSLVLAPEGVPTLSVSYWAFLAPALAWLGCGLLAWRLAETVLRRGRRLVAFAARPFVGTLAPTMAAMLSRQGRLVSRSVVLLTLALAFAFSTATFNATYRQQAEVDAQLTNGADVTVTESPGANTPPSAARQLAAVPGVRGVEPLQHRFAYVGNDLQDLYGVHADTLTNATTLQDAYFQGITADQALSQLSSRPDGVLVSAETVNDFQLNLGDLVRLRLQDARSHGYRLVPFHYVGIVNEFPTAPKDSFIVANANYVATRTHSDAVGTFLVDTGGTDVAAVAARVTRQVGTSGSVTTIDDARGLVGSSLTSVDLSRLTRLELAFAWMIAASAGGLVIGLGLAERQRAVAVATALGADARQVRRFGSAEPAYVLLVGTTCGLLTGWGLSALLVKVLSGVFDPPPSSLAFPWVYLLAVTACTVASVLVAATAVITRARRGARTLLRAL